MIYDKLYNFGNYVDLPKFKVCFDFLARCQGLELGRHELGEGVFANIMEFNSLPLVETRIEAHKKYIDVQYIASGEETMGFALEYSHITTEYDNDKDIYFVNAECSYIKVKQGEFAVFFPTDYHRPSIGHGDKVRKVVVKIPFND